MDNGLIKLITVAAALMTLYIGFKQIKLMNEAKKNERV